MSSVQIRSCVCIKNIDNWIDVHWPTMTGGGRNRGRSILALCANAHEQMHLEICPEGPPCSECEAYFAELQCLQTRRSACTSDDCRTIVDRRIMEVSFLGSVACLFCNLQSSDDDGVIDVNDDDDGGTGCRDVVGGEVGCGSGKRATRVRQI